MQVQQQQQQQWMQMEGQVQQVQQRQWGQRDVPVRQQREEQQRRQQQQQWGQREVRDAQPQQWGQREVGEAQLQQWERREEQQQVLHNMWLQRKQPPPQQLQQGQQPVHDSEWLHRPQQLLGREQMQQLQRRPHLQEQEPQLKRRTQPQLRERPLRDVNGRVRSGSSGEGCGPEVLGMQCSERAASGHQVDTGRLARTGGDDEVWWGLRGAVGWGLKG